MPHDLTPAPAERQPIPRHGPKRPWTAREEWIIRRHYPEPGGPERCAELLPDRTMGAIYQRARTSGVFAGDGKSKNRIRHPTSPAIDDVIRRGYQTDTTKGFTLRIARAIGRPEWWVRKRAQALGIGAVYMRDPPWTPAEIAILEEIAHKRDGAIVRILKRRGFSRSAFAVRCKIKRLRLDRKDYEHFTASELARDCLHIDRNTVNRWIQSGLLKARRRPDCDADQWWIRRRDVREFIIGNVAAIDIRKVDKFWLVDLLADVTRAADVEG